MRKPIRIAAVCAALFLLTAVILYVNLWDAPPATPETVGAAEGELLPDLEIRLPDGTAFRTAELRGKTVVINLWATWCAPCVQELAYFDRLQREYGEEVAVLALHAELVTEDVQAFFSALGYDLDYAVAPDADLIHSLNGADIYPQTIVADADGIVRYNRVGSLTWESLTEIVDRALKRPVSG